MIKVTKIVGHLSVVIESDNVDDLVKYERMTGSAISKEAEMEAPPGINGGDKLSSLNLSVRTRKLLEANHIETISYLKEWPVVELMKIRGMGKVSIFEITAALGIQ